MSQQEWTDTELLTLMRAHAPRGVQPEDMLPVLRGLVAAGTDPRAIVAAVAAVSADSASLQATASSAPAGEPHASTLLAGQEPSPPSPHVWHRRMRRAAIIVVWLLVWEIADRVVDNRLILTGPIRTAQALVEQVTDPQFWPIVAASFGRISLGFTAAFVVGIILALIAHRSTLVRDVMAPVMQVLKTVPMVSFIIMLLIWVGAQALTVWLAFLIVTPLIYLNMTAGLGAVDRNSIEIAQVHRVSAGKRFLYVYRPVFMPFLISACQIGVGMSWKAGIMAEVFATPAFSVGKEMFTAKTFLDTPALFAWTVVVMLLSIAFERLVMSLLRGASRPLGELLGSRR